MVDTGALNPHQKNTRIAHGYIKDKGTLIDNINQLPSKGSPAGGGYSTCRDLFKFAHALQNNQLIDADMTKFILSPKVEIETKNKQTLYYGYGFQILDVGKGHRRFGHAGSYPGANARLDVYPWLGYTVIVLSNYSQPSAFKIANQASRLILESN